MNLFYILIMVPLLQSHVLGRVITSNAENQDVDVYSVQEDPSSHTITMVNPKSAKPTLREIIYYHLIEKPYDGSENIIATTVPPTTTEQPATTDSPTNLIGDTTVNNMESTTNTEEAPSSIHELFNFSDEPTKNSNVDNETEVVNTNIPLETITEQVSLNIPDEPEVPVNTDAPTEFNNSNESLDSNDNNGFNEVNFGSLNEDTAAESISNDAAIQDAPEIIHMEALSRNRRDLADTPNTYGVDLFGNQGTVWNDVSAKGVKFDIGDDLLFENKDENMQITDEYSGNGEIPTEIEGNSQKEITDDSEIVNEDIKNTQEEVLDDNEESIKVVNDDVDITQKEIIDEDPKIENDDLENTQQEIIGENEENLKDINENENNSETPLLKSVEMGESEMDSTVEGAEVKKIETEKTMNSDTKLWGMNLNQNSGTVWNDFAGSTVEYGVGNNNQQVTGSIPVTPENSENSVIIPTENSSEPIPEVSVDENILTSNITEDSDDDLFVTPSSKSLLDSDDSPIEDITVIQSEDMEGDKIVPGTEENIEDVTENPDFMDAYQNIPPAPTLPPLDLDKLPGFMDIAESTDDDTTSATTEDTINAKNLPEDDNESLTEDATDVNLDAFGTEVSLDSTTETTEETTTDIDLDVNVKDDLITDDLTDLLKNRKFFNWIQTWAAAYSEMFKAKIVEIVKEEVTKQIGELDLNCCQKNTNENTDNLDIDHKQDKVRLDSNTIYGNAVGNENVTNMFLFFDKNDEKILEILKPIIEQNSDKSNSIHYISPNLETTTENIDSTTLTDGDAMLDSTIDNLNAEATTEELPVKSDRKVVTRISKSMMPEWVN